METKLRSFFRCSLVALCCALVVGCEEKGDSVHGGEALAAAIANAKAGDVITVAEGTYTDLEVVLTGQGTADAPIKLVAENKGKVFLEGQSSLSISGEYIHVEGLVFRNGSTPTGEVISFQTSDEAVCNHCRVTECVIDNYNPAERFESDYWVAMYGKQNRFDHNYLTGKRNQGVLLAVRLDTEASRENFHRIDHNFFGHRAVLGSNGGETIRIGTSHYCDQNSNTLVESNYFYRCNGEVEIISNKSGQNTYRGNTFFESTGTLTIRHGDETTIANNFFFGNGVANTGGIRIINAKQTVVNNYLEGLTGYRFRSAMTIMNGVPNSPKNRYVQVTDSKAENNVFINCDNVQFCVGSDAERSAVPERTTFANNVVYRDTPRDVFAAFDDIGGITFTGNLLSPGIEPLQAEGFENREIALEAVDAGVRVPGNTVAGDSIRSGMDLMATPENTGVTWYPRVTDEMYFGTGKIVEVKAGVNTLWEAVRESAPGDIIRLTEAGEYLQTKTLSLNHPLTFEAAAGLAEKPVLLFQKTNLFSIENKGGLTLRGVAVSGRKSLDKPLNAVISTSRYSMINNYKLFIEDCDFTDLDVNHSFNVVRVYKNTMADSLVIRDSRFINISGSVLALDQETDDIGVYNAQSVVIDNCLFDNIGQVAVHVHRGGSDESTLGPMVRISTSTFDDIGGNRHNRSGAALRLHGAQVVTIEDCIFDDSKPVQLHLVVGDPQVSITNTVFSGGTVLEDNGEPYKTESIQRNITEPVTDINGRAIGTSLSE